MFASLLSVLFSPVRKSRRLGAVLSIGVLLSLCGGTQHVASAQKPLAITGVSYYGQGSDDNHEWLTYYLTIKNNYSSQLVAQLIAFDCKSYQGYYEEPDLYGLSYTPEGCMSADNNIGLWPGQSTQFQLRLGRTPNSHARDTIMVVIEGSSVAPSDTALIAVDIWGGATIIRPSVPTVTPKATAVTKPSFTWTSETFTIANGGNASATYSLTPSCSNFGSSGCTASPSSITIGAYGTGTATVSYRTPAAGGVYSTIGLTATTGSLTDAGSITVTTLDQVAPTIALSPSGTLTSYARGFSLNFCDADGSLQTPSVVLNGAPVSPAAYYATSVSGCAHSSQADFSSAPLQPGTNSMSASISDGTHTTTMSWSMAYDEGPDVTPSLTAPTSYKEVTAQTYTVDDFVLHNPGSITASYQLTVNCEYGGGYTVTACSIPNDVVSVGAGQSVPIHVAYSTSNYFGGVSIVSLTASHQSVLGGVTTANASMSIALPETYIPAFAPKTTTAPTIEAYQQHGEVAPFLYNNGTASATFAVRVECGAPLSCSTTTPSVNVATNSRANVFVQFSASVPTASAIRIIATAPASAGVVRVDTALVNVTAAVLYPPGIVIYPSGDLDADGNRAPVTISDASALVNVDVLDRATTVGTPVLTMGGATIAPISVNPTNVGYASSMRVVYAFPFHAGNNDVTITASDGVFTTTTQQRYVYLPPMPTVTPKATSITAPSFMWRSDTFTIANGGSGTATYSLVPSCSNFGSSGCTVSPSTITIGPGGSGTATVAYRTPAAGGVYSTIGLTASMGSPALADAGSITVTTADQVAPTIALSPTGTLTSYPRGFSLNFCDADGSLQTPSVRLNGASLSPTAYYATSVSGCAHSSEADFSSAPLQPGANTVSASISDGTHTTTTPWTIMYDNVNDVKPGVSAPASRHVPSDAHTLDDFILQNPGSFAATYQLAANCNGGDWVITVCTISDDSVTVGAGQSLPVHVYYTTSNYPGTSPVSLTATYQSSMGTVVTTSASMNATVDATSIPAFVPRTTTLAVVPHAARQLNISVYNHGTVTAPFAISLDCGAWGACSTPTTTVTVAPGGGGTIEVHLTAGVPGTSSNLRIFATAPPLGGVVSADTATYHLTADDVSPPGISIAPHTDPDQDGYPTSAPVASRNATVTVYVGDWESVVADPTLTINGTTVAATSIAPTSTEYFSSKQATYTVPFQVGTNTVVATTSDGIHTASAEQLFVYDDASEHKAVVSPLHATSQVAVNRTAVDTFMVSNPGWHSVDYNLRTSCSYTPFTTPLCSSTVSASTITVAAGATVAVPVSYATTANLGYGIDVALYVSYSGALSSIETESHFTATVAAVLPPQITITPATGTQVSTPTVSLTVTWCDADDGITQHDVTLRGQSLPDTWQATTVSGCHVSGQSMWTSLQLDPWMQTVVATATDPAGHTTRDSVTITRLIDVSLQRPSVGPKVGSHSVALTAAAADTFTVTNAGSYAAGYTLTPACSGLANCVASPSVLSLAAGESAPVTVSYTGPAVVAQHDTVGLVASFTAPTGSVIADTGKKVVVVPTSEVAPVLTTSTTPIPLEPTYVTTGYFVVLNSGSEPVTYALHATPTGGFGFPDWYSLPANLVVAPGDTGTVVLFVKAPTGDGISGSVTLTADYVSTAGIPLSGSATALYITRAPRPQVAVTPKHDTYVVRAGETGTQLTFAVTNTGNIGMYGQATVTCESSAGTVIAWCGTSSSPTPIGPDVFVGTGESIGFIIDVALRAGIPAKVHFSFEGSADQIVAQDSGTITVRSIASFFAVGVTPKNASLTVNPHHPLTQHFTITNSGTLPTAFDYGTACMGIGIACALTPSGTSPSLNPGESYSVTVDSMTSQAVGLTGAVRLWASGSGVVDTGTVTFNTGTVAELSVNTRDANPGTSIDRGNCLTIAAGDAAAYECGDLRIVHPLPSTMTMNKERTPTLIYDSRHASGTVIFAADVAVAAGNTPSSLTVHVTIGGHAAPPVAVPWDAAWSDGQLRRIAVPVNVRDLGLTTGAYHYVFALDPVGQSTVLQQQDEGTVAIVNRATSPFGPGWWLDGLEQIVPDSTNSHMLWVGGDGTTRLFTPLTADSTVWTVQPALDGIDSLTKDVATSHWFRHLGNGAYTEFDGALRHIATVDRVGHRTDFTYSGAALSTIVLPVPAGSSATSTERNYTFTPTIGGDGVATNLVVTAPPVGGTARSVVFNYQSSGSTWTVSGPDTTHVTLGHDAQGRVTSRTDRRGFATTFTYDSLGGGTLAGSRLVATSPTIVDIARTFCASEAAGLPGAGLPHPCGAGALLTSDVRTVYNGPRTDSSDVTTFTVNQFGAVTRVVDPYGHTTTLSRSDSRWPFLVTGVQAANGLITGAQYDSTNAHVLTSGYGIGRALHVTRYVWDAKWDMITRVVPPAGDSTVIGIDPTTGDRLWEQDARGAMSRVSFTYDPMTRLVATVTQPGTTASDSIVYEPRLGNIDHTTTPLGALTQHQRDAIGRDVLLSMPTTTHSTAPATQSLVYDIMDRVVLTTKTGPALSYGLQNGRTADSAAVQVLVLADSNSYDDEGNLTHVNAVGVGSSSDATTITTSLYDAANRVYSQATGAGTTTFTYDAAGNATTVGYPSGGTSTTAFDGLNRPRTRIVSGRDYGRTRCSNFPEGPLGGSGSGCLMVFPYFPNQEDGGTGLHVSGDTLTFDYDAMGNMTSANNRAARIGRVFTIDGLLQTETTLTGTVTDPRTNGQRSTYNYGYDLDNRRVSMNWQLGTTRYAYTPFGALDKVTDPSGNTYHLSYDAASRQDSLVIAASGATSAGVWERRSYDDDGRMTRRTRSSAQSGLSIIRDDSLEYDLRGKITTVRTGGANRSGETITTAYDGMGAVLAQDQTRYDGAFGVEEYRNDVFGNVLYSRAQSSAGTNDAPKVSTYAPSGHLASRQVVLPATPSNNQVNEDFTQNFDGPNLVRMSQLTTPPEVNGVDIPHAQVAEVHYYTGDNRLAVVQRDAQTSVSVPSGTWEEYWYDALGRRVLTRTRRNGSSPLDGASQLCVTPSPCESYTERAFWDGDRIQYEERTAEDGPPDVQNSGSVGYVHLTDLDQPVAILGTTTSVINYDWRGLAESSVHPDGTPADCSLASGGSCMYVAWPGGDRSQSGVYFRPSFLDNGTTSTPTWLGTLVANGAGSTGELYRRNRYYSSESGQFTQEDPSGLGGGLNMYGFASGDPVNFSDPFGLCTKEDHWTKCPESPDKAALQTPLVDPVAIASGFAAGAFSGAAAGAVELEGTELARALGRAGEEASGLVKNTSRIASHTRSAAYRIPDGLTETTLSEVKNVARLGLSDQLRDFAAYASQRGLKFDLYLRPDTKLTGPLQQFIMDNGVNIRYLKP